MNLLPSFEDTNEVEYGAAVNIRINGQTRPDFTFVGLFPCIFAMMIIRFGVRILIT